MNEKDILEQGRIIAELAVILAPYTHEQVIEALQYLKEWREEDEDPGHPLVIHLNHAAQGFDISDCY